MIRSRLGRLFLAAGIVLALVAASWGVLRFTDLDLRLAALWPLDLAEPRPLFLDWRLRALQRDPVLCRRLLAPPMLDAQPVPDQIPQSGCGWSNAVRLRALDGSRLAADKATCELGVALALWMRHVVNPEAELRLGARVAAVRHLGGYACRTIKGDPRFAHRLSEHATANAIDVSGFDLADGRQVSVRRSWSVQGPEAAFLHAIQAGACRYFRLAIGPGYNAAHRDHFHLDRGRWIRCR